MTDFTSLLGFKHFLDAPYFGGMHARFGFAKAAIRWYSPGVGANRGLCRKGIIGKFGTDMQRFLPVGQGNFGAMNRQHAALCGGGGK
ncbi:MAG TPA: hypothetical protein VGJ15_06410 [Pirellulales bacterium]